jgi:general secretion pathway protein F
MPRFRYTAYSSDGIREAGTVDVATETQAWTKLTSMGLTVVELLAEDNRQQGGSRFGLDLDRGFRLQMQADLADQLAVLFAARLSAMRVVETIEQSAVLPKVRRRFGRIGQLMADGTPFPDALAAVGSGLHPLFISLARIGQMTGDPAPLMKSLATALRREQKLNAQLRGALVYPLILVAGGLGILILMALYLAPQLSTIFTSVDKPVPTTLSAFIATGNLLRAWWPILVLAAVVLLMAGPALVARAWPSFVRHLYRVPALGPLLREASLARLVRSVQIMLAAGMPLAVTLRQAGAAMPDSPLAAYFDAAGANIEAGSTGRDVFGAADDLPSMFKALYAVGEQSNTLPQVMDSVATALEDQVERRIQRAMVLLTPTLTLVIGGGIAFIVYAVMSALLTVNDLAF